MQRWTDQDIVNYLQDEKKIKIARSTVTTIKNQVVEEAGNWYLELRESGTKTIAFYKERLDSLLSYQKKLNEVLNTSEVPEIRIRAIAELHRIEMSLHTIFQELPHDQFQIRPKIDINIGQEPNKKHCYCHYCLPGIGDEAEGAGPLVEESSTSHEPEAATVSTIAPYSSPIEEQTETEIEEEEEEPEETEADRYWRDHPSRVKPTNNNKVKFVIE